MTSSDLCWDQGLASGHFQLRTASPNAIKQLTQLRRRGVGDTALVLPDGLPICQKHLQESVHPVRICPDAVGPGR